MFFFVNIKMYVLYGKSCIMILQKIPILCSTENIYNKGEKLMIEFPKYAFVFVCLFC